MSDNIPFEIQAEIMKRLPVRSLLQIRSVCKAWKSLIDSADFIKHYSSQQQHHLLARYTDIAYSEEQYVLIADDHTFPEHKVSVTIPRLVNMLQNSSIIGSSNGLLCLYGDYQEGGDGPISGTARAVIWNPSIRKTVVVDVPNVAHRTDRRIYETVLGFGVCPETTDPKIVKITQIDRWSDMESIHDSIPWQVEVFTLSSGAWRSPYNTNLPRKSIEFDDHTMVVIDGMFYWLATDRIIVDDGFIYYNLIISFDMTSEEFIEVNLPDSLAHQYIRELSIYKLRESLVVLEPGVEATNLVFCVWIMEDVAPKLFTKLFTIDLPDIYVWKIRVMGFRKTGEPIIDNAARHPERTGSLAVYEPYSKSISSLGINESDYSDFVYSYIETLLLL